MVMVVLWLWFTLSLGFRFSSSVNIIVDWGKRMGKVIRLGELKNFKMKIVSHVVCVQSYQVSRKHDIAKVNSESSAPDRQPLEVPN